MVVKGRYLVSFFFTKADRLLKRHDFLRLTAKGRQQQNKHFIVIFAPCKTERTRFGITVSRKVGNAVVRNRIKRFTREYFRLNRYKNTGSWDINIIAKKEAVNLSSAQAFLFLQNIFDKITRTLYH
ncbi:MAG: ribonuclease P protein component [Desulfobacteraceae bacterium]|nr:ribonuclease P protein component [Desulfobacteraceae bacterium]